MNVSSADLPLSSNLDNRKQDGYLTILLPSTTTRDITMRLLLKHAVTTERIGMKFGM